jgi:hypothetical protein
VSVQKGSELSLNIVILMKVYNVLIVLAEAVFYQLATLAVDFKTL